MLFKDQAVSFRKRPKMFPEVGSVYGKTREVERAYCTSVLRWVSVRYHSLCHNDKSERILVSTPKALRRSHLMFDECIFSDKAKHLKLTKLDKNLLRLAISICHWLDYVTVCNAISIDFPFRSKKSDTSQGK